MPSSAVRPLVATPGAGNACWCGGPLAPWSEQYLLCTACQSLVVRALPAADPRRVADEASDLYGLNYFHEHARALGHPSLPERARLDLPERCAFWLRTLLRYRPPPARTLELGCANGAFVGLLAEAGYDAAGLDLSPAVTAFVRDSFQVPVLTGPLEEQRLAPGSLDVVVMMDVLEHLPDPVGTLRAVAAALAPDGIVLVQTPRFQPGRTFEELCAAGDPFLAQLKPGEHLFLLSPDSARALLAQAGFGTVELVPAIFPQYDMSFVAARGPLAPVAEEHARRALSRSRSSRVAAALLDAYADGHSADPAVPDRAVLTRALRSIGVAAAEETAAADAIRTLHQWKEDREAARARQARTEQELRAARWLLAHPRVLPHCPDARALPLVSIVTPTRNQRRTLPETIASVAAQTYPLVEHVVVDGGSTDGSVQILEAADGIRWLSEPDRGQADAINKGLRLARGTIVAYLNSDDLLDPDAVSIAVEALATNPAVDLVYGDGTVVDGAGAPLWEWLSRPEDWRLLAGYFFLWNDFTNYIMQPATFWRRSLHERIGFFDEEFHFAMDVEFWLRAGRSGARMLHVPQPLARFRWEPGTKTTSSPTAFWEDHLELFRRHHGPRRLLRYVEQYLSEEVRKNAATMDEALARFERLAEKRWASLPEAAELRALGKAAVPGAFVRLADEAWNGGQNREARALLRKAARASGTARLHPRAAVLGAKLLAGPLSPLVRRGWHRAIRAWRERRYEYRYRSRSASTDG